MTREPPKAYAIDGTAFRVGYVYNLDSAVASALIAEGCAELDDTLTPEERRKRDSQCRGEIWEASDKKRAPQWMLLKRDVPSNVTKK
jgi:hypothetical protein